jgi:hypothetical protein
MATGDQLFDRNKSGHSPIFAHPEKFAPEPSPECWQGGFRVARFVVPYGYNTVAPARYHASIRLLKKKRAQPNHGVM